MASRPKSSALALTSPAACLAHSAAGEGREDGGKGSEFFARWTGRVGTAAKIGAGRTREGGSTGVEAIATSRTERLEARAVGDGLADVGLLHHGLVRHDARLPEFVDEALIPRQPGGLRELGGFVPHLGSREADRPPRSRLSPRLSVFVRAVFLRGRRPRRERVMAPRGEAGAAEAIPPLLSRLNGNNPIPDDGLFWV